MSSQVSHRSYLSTLHDLLFSMNWLTSLCLMLAIIYWFYRFIRAIYNLQLFFNIRAFYNQALDIRPVGKIDCHAIEMTDLL